MHDIIDYSDFYHENDIKPVGLDELLMSSDVVTLHLPLDDSTKNILNKDKLNLLRDDAVLINLARGGLIDEQALKKRIEDGKLYGVALDVFNVEPPDNTEFSQLENVLITPHIGGSTEEAIVAMGEAAIKGLDSARDALEYLKVCV